MRTVLLHLDGALMAQARLVESTQGLHGQGIDGRFLGPQLRLWSNESNYKLLAELLAEQLPASLGPALVFAGSGDFHHVSALLIARASEMTGRQLTVLHVDNHPDWVRFKRGVHCGSWVGRAARLPGVQKVITMGVCSNDVRQPWRKGADLALITDGAVELYTWNAPRGAPGFKVSRIERPTMTALGKQGFLDHLLTRISTEEVYITIDKDALASEDAVTNWDQGEMRLDHLAQLIEGITAHHKLVGADVVGDWSPNVYGGSLMARVLKRLEAFVDQPPAPANVQLAADLNEKINLALMAAVTRAAA